MSHASVSVGDEEVGRIGPGLVALLGVAAQDTEEDARYIAGKVVTLRIFPDDAGRFNRSALEIAAELLVISQFTLYAETRKGRCPSFTQAAPLGHAEELFRRTVELFGESGLRVETGRFQEHMMVDIHNDGPVTIMLDSADRQRPRRA